MDRVEEGVRWSAAVLLPCSRDRPVGETDVAQAKVVRMERPSEVLRGREMTPPTSHGKVDVEKSTSLSVPRGSGIQTAFRRF